MGGKKIFNSSNFYLLFSFSPDSKSIVHTKVIWPKSSFGLITHPGVYGKGYSENIYITKIKGKEK